MTKTTRYVGDTLFSCRTKGTDREGWALRYSLNWGALKVKRSLLTFAKTRILFDEWSIPYTEIEDAVIAVVPFRWGLGEARNLMVKWRGRVYQFQIPPTSRWKIKTTFDSFWDSSIPFPVRRERRRIIIPLWYLIVFWVTVASLIASMVFFFV
jgi:hypothetical protein